MRDLLVQAGGLTGIATAIVHGVLGETMLFARARIEPPRSSLMIRLGWQIGAVGWGMFGILLVAAPYLGSQPARTAIVAAAAATYLFGAIANAAATRTLHFGAMLLLAATALAVTGV